jgi:REP element-mobilizing transposase RayT
MRIPPILKNTTYHIYDRGIAKRVIFKIPTDYFFFMLKIEKYKLKYNIDIIKFCLMPNHFHFLIKSGSKPKNISIFMKCLKTSYAYYFNKKYKQSGHVFQGTYNAKPIISIKQMNDIIKYIKNNPVKKGLVQKAEDWPYAG